MSAQFTALQAYVATLAIRLGKPLPVAQLQAMSQQQLVAAKSAANTALTRAQVNASAAAHSGQPVRPVSASQQAGLSAWANAFGVATPQPANGLQANTWLASAGRRAKGQHGLVYQVYTAWLAAVTAPQSAQLALF